MGLLVKLVLTCMLMLCYVEGYIARHYASGPILKTKLIVPEVKHNVSYLATRSWQSPLSRFKRVKRDMEDYDYGSNPVGVCDTPDKSETATIHCKWEPERVLCSQTCIYGYTFEEGTMRRMECFYHLDTWKPVPYFAECEPYVDCTLSLGPGAKQRCLTHSMSHGPVCNLSCAPYEDKPAIPDQTYSCDDKGNWTPPLPFCVTQGRDDFEIVDPPTKRRKRSFEESDDGKYDGRTYVKDWDTADHKDVKTYDGADNGKANNFNFGLVDRDE